MSKLMGFLTRVDNAISGAVEKIFRVRSAVQLVDIAILLKRAVSSSEIKLPYDTYVPDRWTVLLPEQMYDEMEPLLTVFSVEAERYLHDYIQPKGYRTVRRIKVAFEKNGMASKNKVVVRGALSRMRGGENVEPRDHR
jgi:hypothetical protein